MSDIYNISSSCCFVETLAQKLLKDCADNELDLVRILIFLPNRRACRSLAEAFVRLQGMQPTLLPQMRAIGDASEDEILFNSSQDVDYFLNLPPAITPLERTLLLAKLIMSRQGEFGLENISPAQACGLAQELGSLLDNVAMRGLDWHNLQNIVPDEYAAHWQETLKFLTIITEHWPNILAERNMTEAVNRRDTLILKQCELWQNNPPQQRVIVAGTTAVSPAMKELVRTVYQLPLGEVYLAGLDKVLDDDAWDIIDETHPQYEIKQLLEYLKVARTSVIDLVPPHNNQREKLISEIMRPASCSDQWRNLSSSLTPQGVSGIHLMESESIREEALSIAMLIRDTLEKPEQTIALVTTDRNLSRRVCGELTRWDIVVDDSAGTPLNQTAWGIFMRLIAEVSANVSSKSAFLALLKQNLLQYQSVPDTRKLAEKIDKNLWRLKENNETAQSFLNQVTAEMDSLIKIFQQSSKPFNEILKQHILLAETLSSPQNDCENIPLWSGDDGQSAAAFISELLDKSNLIGDINPSDYLGIFEKLISNIMVRNTTPTHPRIKILGPLEARLNHYDTIIIGGCNEGTWPQNVTVDPWMSRPMKRDFGLNQPEQQIGVTALDFALLLGADNVYLTRSQMNNGAQTVKSRWWMRLTTVLQAININPQLLLDNYFIKLAKKIDQPEAQDCVSIKPPAPNPPLYARPQKLSASAFEKLMRDPYSVFAEYILKLKPLDELETSADQSDFGNLVHKVLDEFAKEYPQKFPQNAKDILRSKGEQAFNESDFSEDKLAFWRPKFTQIVDWIVAQESNYRQQISEIKSEIWGKMFFDETDMGKFEIYAKADRVDLTKDGKCNIIDYKTGRARSVKEVKTGYAPQLPIEALIANNGGFTDIPPVDVEELMYWKLGDKIISITGEIDKLLDSTKQHIIEIINRFADPKTCYLSRPNPKHVPEYSDYEHLARVKEWSIRDEGDDN